MGTFLYECGPDQGPLGAIPGSHMGPLCDQFNDKGQWGGCLSSEDLAQADPGKAEYLCGPTGSVTIHNCRLIHGSAQNLSDLGRPLLLNVFSSADAFPYTYNPIPSRHAGAIVRGSQARTIASRSPALSHSARLVGRLYLHLRPTAGRNLG